MPLQALLPVPKRQIPTRLAFRTAAMAVEAPHKTEAPSSSNPPAKVEELRKLMAAADGGRGVQAYIIPSEDTHMVPPLTLPATQHLTNGVIAVSHHSLTIPASADSWK